MVESLDEIRGRCQKPRYKTVGNWMVRHILRDAALPFTWLLLHTSVTANQVTAASFLTGVLAAICLGYVPNSFFLTGVFLLQLWYYLDHVDGQIARYRGTACLTGRFFDFVMHHVIHGLLLFSLGFYLYQRTGQIFFVIWGFTGSLSTMTFNLYYDTQYKTYFEKIMTLPGLKVKKMPIKDAAETLSPKKKLFKRIFFFLHKSHEIHVFMNVLTLAALLQVMPLTRPIDWRAVLFIYYGLAAPCLALVKFVYILRGRMIDREFQAAFDIETLSPVVQPEPRRN